MSSTSVPDTGASLPDPATEQQSAPPIRPWSPPPSSQERRRAGKDLRGQTPRTSLATLGDSAGRRPFEILDEQNSTRVEELVPMRAERMSANPFSFYRGAAAIMAADLAAEPHTGILVPSCGDAHIANFGFYASPQRTLMFDLNDFDEAGWAPWEWDLKRLLGSVVVAGLDSSRDDAVIRTATHSAVIAYARAMSAALELSPSERYFTHLDPTAGIEHLDPDSRRQLETAMKDAHRRACHPAPDDHRP